jgi:hypothetical protein
VNIAAVSPLNRRQTYGVSFDDPDAWRTSLHAIDFFNKFITTADDRLQRVAGPASNLDEWT